MLLPILELNQIPDAYKTPALTGELMGSFTSSRLRLRNITFAFNFDNITDNEIINSNTIYVRKDDHVVDSRQILTFLVGVHRFRT